MNIRYLILLGLIFFTLSGESQVTNSPNQGTELYPVIKNLKWGLIDKTGKIIVQPWCDGFSDFNSLGYAYIYMGDKKGIIFREGNLVIKPEYTDIVNMDTLYFAVFDGENWGIYHKNGEKILDNIYPKLNYLQNNFFTFGFDSLFGLLNRNGKIIVDTLYNEYIPVKYLKYLMTVRNNHFGLIDTTGSMLVECKYSSICFLNSHFAACRTDSSDWVGIDLDDGTIVDGSWSKIKDCNPYIGFKNNDQWSLYSRDRHQFHTGISCNDIFGLDSNFVLINRNGKLGVIDSHINIIIPDLFDTIVYLPDRGFIVDSMNLFGLYGLNGSVLIPPSLTDIIPGVNNPNLFTAYFNSFYGLYRYDGQALFPLVADEIQLFQDCAKIYQNTTLTIMVFDSNGEVTDNQKFYDVHRIRIYKSEWQSDFTPSSLRINKDYGWFYSDKKRKWGLKDSNNKVVINPAFYDVKVLNNQYSIVMNPTYNNKTEAMLGGRKIDVNYFYGLVDHKNYKIIARTQFLDIRNDFSKGCNVTRVITNSNYHFGLLYKNGTLKTKDISYVGEFSDSMAGINLKGEIGDKDLGTKNSASESITLDLNVLRFSASNNVRLRTATTNIFVTGGSWGFINIDGKLAVPAIYSEIKNFNNGKAIVAKKDKWGVIDKSNNTIINFNYDRIERLDNSGDSFFKLINKVNQKGIINISGNIRVRPKFDDIGKFSENLVKVKIGKYWGFADASGNIIIKAIYREVRDFHEGRAGVKLGRKWGFIDTLGEYIVTPYFREVRDYHEGKACVYPSGKCGFIDLWGDTIIMPVFKKASDFSNGHSQAKKKSKIGIMNESGKWVIYPKYTDVKPFDEYGIAIVSKGNKRGLIDNNGKKIMACRYTEIGQFSEGLAYVKKKNKYGYIDLNGKIVIPVQYDQARSFSEGLAAVAEGYSWGYIDSKGNYFIHPSFIMVSDFHNNRASFKSQNKFGLLDKRGNIILRPNYFYIGDFSHGMAFIKTSNNSGHFVDSNGNWSFSLVVEDALPFKNGIALVKVDKLWGMINIYGNFIISPQFTMLKQISDTTYSFVIREYSGIADLNGKIILEPVYEKITYMGRNIFRVELNNCTGYIDIRKNWIWKPTR